MEGDELLENVSIDMSEDLKESEQEVQQTKEVEESPEPSALATEQEPEPDKSEGKDSETLSEKAQAAINKKHRLWREAQEAGEEKDQRINELEAELSKIRGDDVEPTIPPPPDPYSENYAEEIQARDQAIKAHAEWTRNQSEIQRREYEAHQEAARAAQKELADLADGYAKRAVELKVNSESLQKASAVVAGYGVTDEFTRRLLRDEEGPLLTEYLASDIEALEEVASLPPYEAGQYIERVVRPKAQALRPKASEAPTPPEVLGGGGPGDDILGDHKGVTIE